MNSSIDEITTSLRKRAPVSRVLSDQELWELALFAGCNDSQDLIQYSFCRQTASEISDHLSDISLTTQEWNSAFGGVAWNETTSVTPTSISLAAESLQDALVCTLLETEQSRRWNCPINKTLVYIAIHSKQDVDTRVKSVLGELVRTDTRRLDDIRATMVSETERITTITTAASIVSQALRL